MATTYEINATVKNGIIRIPKRYLANPIKKVRVFIYPEVKIPQNDRHLIDDAEFSSLIEQGWNDYHKGNYKILTPELQKELLSL